MDTNVNTAFTADKLNTAKRYADITDWWHVHYKRAKTFQSGLSCYDGGDIALHKRVIERDHIFKLLKL